MAGFNLHANPKNSQVSARNMWNRGPKAILAVSLMLLVPIVGTSLASKVTVNNDKAITFGQGYSTALACSGDINIKPAVHMIYGQPITWAIWKITLENINTMPTNANGIGCGGKKITIQARSNGTALGIPISFTLASTAPWNAAVAAGVYAFDSSGSAKDTLVIFISSEISATNLNGFTIEESDAV
jgi:hypothetical protein